MSDSSKRETLKIIGTIGLQCAFPFEGDELYGQHVHVAPTKSAALPAPTHFRGEDLTLLTRVVELIVPGAKQAQVPAYIDLVVAKNPEHQATYAAGFAWLRQQKFLTRNEAEQIALLEELCAAVDQGNVDTPQLKFFRAAKNMSSDGYFTSRQGLMLDLGYKGNQVLAEFPECTINEH